MLRRIITAAVLAVPAALVTGSVAQAAEPVPTVTYVTPTPGANAAQACANSDNAVTVELRLDGQVIGSFPVARPGELTRGACVSTVTRQELTTAAYVANCKNLEPMFAAENPTGRPYPYAFYGNPEYTAKNRAGCVAFLRAFHTGTLPPGP
jgi:hypothetical protein